MLNFNYGIYPVITEKYCNGRESLYVLKEVIRGGAKIVQLREKDKSIKEIYELALKYREITEKYNVTLIIDDYIDIAMAVKADGVHLGQKDLPCKAARMIASSLIIGISTHNEDEIKSAINDGASYINIGPIFKTSTKETDYSLVGIEYLKKIKPNFPFSIMGGIKREHIKTLTEIGIKNIAMVTEITMADNIAERVSEIINLIEKYRG